MDLNALVDRFGAATAEPIHLGNSEAVVVRLDRGRERLFYKAGPGVDHEADRLAWLGTTGFPCPRVVGRGNNWLLTSELPGRDASQPWPARDRVAVLAAIADGIRQLHELTDCPFTSPFPGERDVVTHGDYAAPNVFIDPETLQFTGILDLARLGTGDRYIDLALMYKSLSGELNPQYGGPPAARRFVEAYGGEADDPRIRCYIDLDDSGDF
ncbi:aminoglycoside phosphotransferase [Kribbella pittospori]|uniref:Aminoglycoside phosphotransferase n=1 Tax=Kribbella pittospori TaxID=722689 RepID=A0A4R0KUX2_9ACTN|nr:phosphotransferase [Kribbella pittospori]TCC64399.1 aminoglycoside phosphotransferase [Kribbella pittospori]